MEIDNIYNKLGDLGKNVLIPQRHLSFWIRHYQESGYDEKIAKDLLLYLPKLLAQEEKQLNEFSAKQQEEEEDQKNQAKLNDLFGYNEKVDKYFGL